MTVISDQANIFLTNEDFSELMDEVQRLTEENEKLKLILNTCVNSWGDYVPTSHKARSALMDAKKALEQSNENI